MRTILFSLIVAGVVSKRMDADENEGNVRRGRRLNPYNWGLSSTYQYMQSGGNMYKPPTAQTRPQSNSIIHGQSHSVGNTQQLGYRNPQLSSSPQVHAATQNKIPAAHMPQFVEREVVVTAEPEAGCPNNFELNNHKNKCIKQDRRPSKLGCKKGWIYKDGVCYNNFVESPDWYCPDGYHDDQSYCTRVHMSPQQLTCPKDYARTGNVCEKALDTVPDYNCPEQFTYDVGEGVCVRDVEEYPSKVCDEGFSLTVEYCRRDLIEERGPTGCPPTYMESLDGRCFKFEVTDPTLVCASDMQLIPPTHDGGHYMCVGVIKEDTNLSCPSGYEMTVYQDSVMCSGVREVAPTINCPDQFEQNEDGECVRFEKKVKLPKCRSEYVFENTKCVKSVKERAAVLCAIGYTLVEDVCMKELRTSPRPSCPSTFQYNRLTKQCFKIQVKNEVQQPSVQFDWNNINDDPLREYE